MRLVLSRIKLFFKVDGHDFTTQHKGSIQYKPQNKLNFQNKNNLVIIGACVVFVVSTYMTTWSLNQWLKSDFQHAKYPGYNKLDLFGLFGM